MRKWIYRALICVAIGILPGCKDNALTAAGRALNSRDLKAFERSLDKAKDVNAQSGRLKRTLAHQFVLTEVAEDYQYFDQVVTIFVKKGGDLNSRDIYGRTALHYAVLRQSGLEIVTSLISHGADPTIKDKTGSIPADSRGQSQEKDSAENPYDQKIYPRKVKKIIRPFRPGMSPVLQVVLSFGRS